jgi:uncharacterized SAM-dependent methyltransferase
VPEPSRILTLFPRLLQQRHRLNHELQRAQTVAIPRASTTVRFEPEEFIWTESSYKYSSEQVAAMGAAAGFRALEQWVETEARFALTLFLAE